MIQLLKEMNKERLINLQELKSLRKGKCKEITMLLLALPTIQIIILFLFARLVLWKNKNIGAFARMTRLL